ncbi:MAG TPA: thioesterase family protein [Vicinamibacterales bacterium]|nr:thioesterase family protein [Vicinamibacterales bacterium]
MSLFHHWNTRVMWADADAAGILWFGVFFRYFENAEEDLFRRLGRERTAMLHELGIYMPRTSLQSRFRSPAKLGDDVSIGIGVADISDRRIGYAFDVHERGTGRLICEASYRVACVEAATFAPRAFPAEIAELLRPAMKAAPHLPPPGMRE